MSLLALFQIFLRVGVCVSVGVSAATTVAQLQQAGATGSETVRAKRMKRDAGAAVTTSTHSCSRCLPGAEWLWEYRLRDCTSMFVDT